MELFYLTAVPQLTLELRSVPTSLSYSNLLRVDLVGGGIMTSRKEAKTLFIALLQHALSCYVPPLLLLHLPALIKTGSVSQRSLAAHPVALPAKSNLLTFLNRLR